MVNSKNKQMVGTSKWNMEISVYIDSELLFCLWKDWSIDCEKNWNAIKSWWGCFKEKERLKMWKLNLGLLSVYFWLIFQ